MTQNAILIGWTTVASADEAKRLAQGAVEAGLAACVQMHGPVTSFYQWKGRLEESSEWRLVFKFSAGRAEALEKWLQKNHPYETPQWVACRAERVTPAYARWVEEGD